MKKSLLLFMAVLATAISVSAQTGSLVREDRVWTHGHHTYHWEKIYEYWTADGSCHFDGSCERNGKTYMVLRDENNEQVALMRQEGGKVYRYTDESVQSYFDYVDNIIEDGWWNERVIELWKEHSNDFKEETLLYDFDAKPGDKYLSCALPLMLDGEEYYGAEFMGVLEIEVIDCYTINVNGADYSCQAVRNNLNLRDKYIIVEGIGPNIGSLVNPMFEYPLTTGFSSSELITYSVADKSGNVLFKHKDFDTDHVRVPGLRRWEYVYASQNGSQVDMTMYYITNGNIYADSLDEKTIKWSYTIDELTGELVYNQDKTILPDYLSGITGIYDNGGILYMTLTDEMREKLQLGADYDTVMLYDFNAKAGDTYQIFKMEQSFDGTVSNPSFEEVTVLETGYTEIENQNCRIHKIRHNGREYSIIEGIGSIETGLLPYSNIFDPGNGSYSGFRLNRVFNFLLNKSEEHIIYRTPNYIDIDNLGNTDGVEALFGEQLGLLHYDGNTVTANGLKIYLYDMSGSVVKEGFGNISTENLQLGMYVAKAGTKTLKILVK